MLRAVVDWREPLKDGLMFLVMLTKEKCVNAVLDACDSCTKDDSQESQVELVSTGWADIRSIAEERAEGVENLGSMRY
jgi:hypothetical protein